VSTTAPDIKKNRIALPNRNASSASQTQPQQSGNRRNHPHSTGYNRSLEVNFVCRCPNHARHGDAWSPRATSGESYDGIPRRDTTDTRITWEESTHRALDILGKDYASMEEIADATRQIFDADTTRKLGRKERNAKWAMERGLVGASGIDHDAIWVGRINPKGCMILSAPDDPDVVFIGSDGGYRPGPTASAQGTRIQ
jgi:hypothetical protein